MKAFVDKDECTGCELCVDICPEVFRMDDDWFAEAYGEVTADNLESAQEAADSCPVECITVEA